MIEKIINEEIAEAARNEALEIISLASDADIQEIINYYKSNNGNLICMHLDTIKYNLVKDGKLKQEPNDRFGKIPYIDD